jgi:translation initiation factor IF-1
MNCIKCQNPIPQKRIEILPNTKTCVSCSDTKRVAGHPMITGKTEYSQLQIVDQDTADVLYHMQSRKGFGVATGVKFKFDSRKN